jgi:hypothetical protein
MPNKITKITVGGLTEEAVLGSLSPEGLTEKIRENLAKRKRLISDCTPEEIRKEIASILRRS